MKILDLQNLGYKRVIAKDLTEIEVFIKYYDLLNMTLKELNAYLAHYWESLDEHFSDKMASYLINIMIEDSAVAKDEEDGLRQIVGDSFIEYFITDGARKEEDRLAIPNGLVSKVSKIRFLQLVNKKTRADNVACFVDINGKKERIF